MDVNVKFNQPHPAVAAYVTPATQSPTELRSDQRVEETRKPQRQELEDAVKDLQEFVNSSRRDLGFSIDDSTGTLVVKVIATESGEVIRQLPSEAALKLAQSLADVNSLLFNEHI